MIRRILTAAVLSVLVLAVNARLDLDRVFNPPTCQEDQPCWNPAKDGNGAGYVCSIELDGSIQRWHDTTGMTGTPVDCPR